MINVIPLTDRICDVRLALRLCTQHAQSTERSLAFYTIKLYNNRYWPNIYICNPSSDCTINRSDARIRIVVTDGFWNQPRRSQKFHLPMIRVYSHMKFSISFYLVWCAVFLQCETPHIKHFQFSSRLMCCLPAVWKPTYKKFPVFFISFDVLSSWCAKAHKNETQMCFSWHILSNLEQS